MGFFNSACIEKYTGSLAKVFRKCSTGTEPEVKLGTPITGYQGTPPSVNWDHLPPVNVGLLNSGYQGNCSLGVN